MSDAIITRGSWFDALCARHNLEPADPIVAEMVQPGDVLFTATGDPRTVKHVRRLRTSVKVEYTGDLWRDYFPHDAIITFVAHQRGADHGA